MLRSYLGDEAFYAGLHHYLVSNAYKSVEVHHLRLAFEEVTGEDLNWFLINGISMTVTLTLLTPGPMIATIKNNHRPQTNSGQDIS